MSTDPLDSIILPSQIFGESGVKIEVDRREIDKRAQRVAELIRESYDYDQVGKIDKDKLKTLLLDASGANIKIAHVSLKILQKNAKTESEKHIFKEIDREICFVLHKPMMDALDFVSPREISLQEGELPSIPYAHRQAISEYLRGVITLPQVIEKLGMTKERMPEILKSIKVMDLEADRMSVQDKLALKYVNTTYTLRTICLQTSEGTMPSYEAYTKSINRVFYDNPFSTTAREYASHESNYIAERVRDHLRVMHAYGIDMMALSRRLATEKRVFYCIGGNTAVGKSRCAKTDEEFRRGLVDGEIVGALNPDTVKGRLRKDVPRVTNQQIHVEGFAIAQKLSGELRNRAIRASVVIDERLGIPPVVEEIVKTAQQTEATVKYKDIDGSLLVSCLRVLGRSVDTDPCVPFTPISAGYKALRQNREKVIEMVKRSETVESYQLFVADAKGDQVLAAEKKGGSFVVHDSRLYATSLETDIDKEILEVGQTQISEGFLAQIAVVPGVDAEAVARYRGMTVADALDRHSKELPFTA